MGGLHHGYARVAGVVGYFQNIVPARRRPFLIWGNGDAIGVADLFLRSGYLVCMTDRRF